MNKTRYEDLSIVRSWTNFFYQAEFITVSEIFISFYIFNFGVIFLCTFDLRLF
jgi:hypothetical protein